MTQGTGAGTQPAPARPGPVDEVAERLVDLLDRENDEQVQTTCQRCGDAIEWDPDELDWRRVYDDEMCCPAGFDERGEQVGSIDHLPMPGVAVPILEPVVLILDRSHAARLRSLVRDARRKRERRIERSGYVPAPGHKNMDVVVAAFLTDVEQTLDDLVEDRASQARVPFRPGGEVPAT